MVNDPTVPIPIRRPQLSDLTPFILAWNEEANLGRCLDSLTWATQILVVDSGSTDRTLEIAAKYPQVRVVQRPFDCHSNQGNFGLSQITTPWVLSLDADYILTPEFQQALRDQAFAWEKDCVYFASFLYRIYGRTLRGTLYPPRGVLYAREGAHYDQDGHAHRISLAGKRKVLLPYKIYNDDRKPIGRWLRSQETYARMEVDKLAATPREDMKIQDKLRCTGWAAPFAVIPFTLLVRGQIFDGWPGVAYVLQRFYAELLLALLLLDDRVRNNDRGPQRAEKNPAPVSGRPEVSDITPCILTWNEEANIARCLDSLTWARQILVVDSGSSDRTLEICASYPQVRVVQRPFDCHSAQANFGLSLITTPWVLSLDADYILTPEFQRALQEGAFPWEEDCIYYTPFVFCIFGRRMHGNVYPPRGVFYALKGAHYDQDGHTQRISRGGKRAVKLPYAILHDDRKSIARWLSSQEKYAGLEAEKLGVAPTSGLKLPDRLRHTGWAAPLIVFPWALVFHGQILDGVPGLYYALQRVYAELLLALLLLYKRLRRD